MNRQEISHFLEKLSNSKERNIVIIDFANVDRWQNSLGWPIGIKQLGRLVSHIAFGKKFLRRFYYGEDFGPKDSSKVLLPWSEQMLMSAKFSNFEIITKRVKYIPDAKYQTGYIKKCNLDIEMAVDLIKEQENYDTAIIFSGDGDMASVCKYIHETFNKKIYMFGARDHVGKELIDAKRVKIIADVLFVEDFEYRLSLNRSF